ncbi:MAG: glycosyltransferase family 4 protein [Solirubrobacteraceae bacterium]|nr:glycosyltransferase family 4 protein [Solirubrobacteraceae bacterium]
MPLDVVYFNHVSVPSGAETALVRLLSALDGVNPHVILAEDGWLLDELTRSGVRAEVIEFPARTRSLPRDQLGPTLPARAVVDTARYTRTLAARLRELRPDLVHTNSLKANVYGTLAAQLAGVPSVWHARDRLAADYLPAAAVPAIRRFARTVPDAVISVSESARQSVLDGRAATASFPVIHDALPSDAEAHPRSTDPDRFVVAMTGRISEWKGQDVFLRAFAQAFADRPCAEAHLLGRPQFGETAYESELHALARDLGIADRVTFAGHVEDVWTSLSGFDVVVHASRIPEPFGQVLPEAMAAGCAVICAGAGGPLEIVEDGVTGLHARPGDVDDYARALTALYEDRALLRRLARAGQGAALSDFAPARVARQVLDCYEATLAAPQHPEDRWY